MSSPCLSRFHCNIADIYEMESEPFDSGQFGKVYKGKRKSDDLNVAIKVLDGKSLQADSEWDPATNQKNLIREINLLANLNHPFCLQLINFNLDSNPAIVTPFMPNGNLMTLILNKDPTLSTQKMCSLYAICTTMDFLHSIGIIHRDIKPQNIFIKENNDICIADFGSSRKVDLNILLTLKTIGSPAYIAPELINCKSYDNKVDVFSFGSIYYNMLTMSKSFRLNDGDTQPSNIFEYMNRVAAGARFVRPENATDDQYKFYRDCTNKLPDERPTFSELADRFETDKSIWLDGVKENDFRSYIEKCKSVRLEAFEKHRDLALPGSLSLSGESSLTNLTRSALHSSKKTQRQSPKKHFNYDDV